MGEIFIGVSILIVGSWICEAVVNSTKKINSRLEQLVEYISAEED